MSSVGQVQIMKEYNSLELYTRHMTQVKVFELNVGWCVGGEIENNPNPGLIRNSHRARRNFCPRESHVSGNFEAIFA